MKALPALILTSFLLTLGARAEPAALLPLPDPKAPLPPAFTLECRMVTVPAKVIPSLLPDLSDDTKFAAGWQRVEEMIGRGEAMLTGSLIAKGIGSEQVTAESVEEMRYATEYQPPQLPGFDGNPTAEQLKNWPHVGMTPTAFETRNVGQMLEAKIGRTTDPKVLVCTCVVQHVRFERFEKIDAGRLADGSHLAVEQPYFSAMKDQSIVTLTSGQPKLLGVHRLPGALGLYELFIVRLRVEP